MPEEKTRKGKILPAAFRGGNAVLNRSRVNLLHLGGWTAGGAVHLGWRRRFKLR